MNLQEVFSIVSIYGYNKKSHELYVETDKANCIVTVSEDSHKILKKSKSIPFLKPEELAMKANSINQELDKKFQSLNDARLKHIEDSLFKTKADSIEKIKQDSLKRVEEQTKLEKYRKENKWYMIPVLWRALLCDLCGNAFSQKTHRKCFAVKNDSLYFCTDEKSDMGNTYTLYHVVDISKSLKKQERYIYHIQAFSDSIEAHQPMSRERMIELNHIAERKINEDARLKIKKDEEDIRKAFPFGYVVDWSWNDEYSNVTFSLTYFNTCKKAIKYIDTHFRITNAVGDVRKTGVFKGTGPVESFEYGEWNWDSSHYYVAGDATKMEITQIVLTFMDGTKKALAKNQIKYK